MKGEVEKTLVKSKKEKGVYYTPDKLFMVKKIPPYGWEIRERKNSCWIFVTIVMKLKEAERLIGSNIIRR